MEMSTDKGKRGNALDDEEDESKPVCLVVEHKVEQPSHSHSIVVAGTTAPPAATTPLLNARHGMSFAVVRSRWLVGVGGDYRGHSTIYDLATSTEMESGGPWLFTSKLSPLLIPDRDMLYVLSSRPSIDHGPDYEPWFEGFLFRDEDVPRFGGCSSRRQPPPPIFPCCINPLEYLNPPDVRVAAYAVVDSHILLSISYTVSDSLQRQLEAQIPPEVLGREKGTCAFNMDRSKWEMVHRKNLPFLGEARHLGGHLFAATRPKDGAAVSMYHIEILSVGAEGAMKAELRIVELTMVGCCIVQGQLFCALGKGSLSTFDVQFKDPTDTREKARLVQHTYGVSMVDSDGETSSAPVSVVVKQRRSWIYKIVDRSSSLLVAALTL